MTFKIQKHGDRLLVQIENLAGREEEVISAVQGCRRQSAWACPSGECTKIDTLDAKSAGGAVLLTLSPRPGMELSITGIEECLRYMLGESVVPKPLSAKSMP
jgi:hypothetical protein